MIWNWVFGTAGSYELIPLFRHIASHEAFDSMAEQTIKWPVPLAPGCIISISQGVLGQCIFHYYPPLILTGSALFICHNLYNFWPWHWSRREFLPQGINCQPFFQIIIVYISSKLVLDEIISFHHPTPAAHCFHVHLHVNHHVKFFSSAILKKITTVLVSFVKCLHGNSVLFT